MTPDWTSDSDCAWLFSQTFQEDRGNEGGLDVHLRHRVDDPDLADGDLEVFGLDLSEAKRRFVGLVRFVLAPGGDERPSRDHGPQDPEQDPALLFLRHFPSAGMHTNTRNPSECSDSIGGQVSTCHIEGQVATWHMET